MNKVFFVCTLSLFMLFSGHNQTQAQTDTMDFHSFLNLCQDFSRSNSQELWVVTFWASWNNNSRYQLSSLKSTYFNYRHKPIRFFFISNDRSVDTWRTALEQEQLPGTQILVRASEDYEYLKQGFQHNSIPAIFLVDQQGNIYRVERVQQLREMLEEESRNLPDVFASNDPQVGMQPARPSAPGNQVPNDPVPPPSSEQGGQGEFLTHTVRRSETLYSISRQYQVSVDEIKAWNNLSDNLIKVNQELRIRRQ